MKFTQLCQHVGDENIQFQVLDECVTHVQTNKKGITKITFGTQAVTANEFMYSGQKAKLRGLVVWLPIDKLPTETPSTKGFK
jgi:hypothetical protein